MKTVTLRYGENIAPEGGTIAAHNELISQNGGAWYGKFETYFYLKIPKNVLNAPLFSEL